MKKVFLFAVAAAALVACSNEELSTPENSLVNSKEAPVNFSVYTQRGMTRAGAPGDLTNDNIGEKGFGVFAYYTAGEGYDQKATPNFMYNQKVTCDGTATAGTLWKYEPVKYWPNEYGSTAVSEEVDQLTFFAYAPWTEIEPTTGNIVPKSADPKFDQTHNIISVNKNTATGDPIVKYIVDTDPATSVDLLWGVASADAANQYSAITTEGAAPQLTPGLPFINLVKPDKPATDRLQFNLRHSLAKVRVTIDYIDDAATPGGPAVKKINSDQTRIFVRSFKMSGFAMKGALNLNNTEANKPLWKDFDGVKDLAFDEVVFQDGRKDGKEGETNGTQSNETPQGLNPDIIENFSQAGTTFGSAKNLGVGAMTAAVVAKATVNNDKAAEGTVLLFGGDPAENGGYFYVIPRNDTGGKVDVTIAYDVETIDPALAGKLSDGETHGISIENIISKSDIFEGVDFMPGYVYEIKLHLGMTSVKIEATVQPWEATNSQDVDLPDNQSANQSGNQGGNTITPGSFGATIANAIQGATATSDTEVTISTTAANLAATLTALHGAGVNAITYNGTAYPWSDEGAQNDHGFRRDGQGGPREQLLQNNIDTNADATLTTTDGTITLQFN
ncbi:MAG: hypothetical protein IKH43_06005 [Bacteroidaceae bacterium]|nr:hypothetical protein [Bacteroidaceae bacterium]